MSNGFYLRLDEDDKSEAQKAIRERTYQAAKVLKAAGFPCEVIEHFTGKDTSHCPASIQLSFGV